MGYVATLWGMLPAVLYFYNVFEVTWSLEGNGSSSLSVSLTYTEYRLSSSENNSDFRRVQHAESLFPTRKDSQTGNFSLKKISFKKIRSVDQNNETFDGFEFVDSPEIPPDAPGAIEKISGGVDTAIGVDRSIIGGTPLSSNNGANIIDKNLWKSYRNGTIIHDVHISLVHPANMAGITKEGNPDGSAPVEPDHDSKMRTNTTREGRASPEPGLSLHDSTNDTTMTSSESVFMDENSSTIAYNRSDIYALYGSTVLPSIVVTNASTSGVGLNTKVEKTNGNVSTSLSTAGQVTLDEKLKPVINLLGVSIIANGTCLSECLSHCYTAESHGGLNQATCLPSVSSCLPLLGDSVKGKLEGTGDYFPEEKNASTAATVPILPLDEIGLLKIKESTEPKLEFLLEDICLSESCVLKAADVLRRMEKSADPCDSFYKFACGGYFKNEIPEGESSRSIFTDISSDILARMYSVLKSPLLADDHQLVKLLKKFYGKCMLTSPKELFMEAVKELGGWPSPDSPSQRAPQHLWGEIAFNWTHGMFLEYNLVSLNLTFANEKDMWMLNVDYPWFVKKALNSDSLSVLDEMERDVRKVASTLGIDSTITRSVLVDLRIFMASAIKCAKAAMSSDVEKGVYSLKELKTKFIHLDLMKKLPSLLQTITVIDDNEMVCVSNMMYLRKVDDLLRDSTVRTQAAHVVLIALRSLSVLIGTATDNVMEKYCVKLTGKLFPHLFNNLYTATFVSNSKVASAARIVTHIRDSLLSMLDENVNGTTLDKITNKIKKLVFIWSNRNEVDDDDLNGIARGFDENPSFLGYVKTGMWNLKKVTYTYLHQRVNSSLASFIERYSGDDYGVNAFYYSQHVLIPSSALHENIFDPEVPPYVNFGRLGLIVGHELLHSVIAAGDISNAVNYKNTEKCIINQFNKFANKKDSLEDRVNGVLTKDENMADYGGFKIAYRAFMEWYNHSSKESKEKRLPGLQKFNEKQMFWLTAATNWCQKVSPDFESTSVDRHAPPEYRIDGQFANIPEFAQDFNCPENSSMNPKEKCSLW